jgi:hypothetical protein
MWRLNFGWDVRWVQVVVGWWTTVSVKLGAKSQAFWVNCALTRRPSLCVDGYPSAQRQDSAMLLLYIPFPAPSYHIRPANPCCLRLAIRVTPPKKKIFWNTKTSCSININNALTMLSSINQLHDMIKWKWIYNSCTIIKKDNVWSSKFLIGKF